MNKYIYLLAVVFGLSGCNDFLELSPTNKVIETDYYKTQEDLTEALVAAYDPLKWNAYNAYSSYELVSNIMSDDAETGGSTVSDQPQLQRVYFIISSCGVSLDTYRITRRIWDWMI